MKTYAMALDLIDDENIISEYIDSKTDELFQNILIENGFKLIQENNEKVFAKENIIISYKEIKIGTSNLEFIRPKIEIKERNNSVTVVDFQSINIGLSLRQLIYLIEELIYEEELSQLSNLAITLNKGYLSQINNFESESSKYSFSSSGELKFD